MFNVRFLTNVCIKHAIWLAIAMYGEFIYSCHRYFGHCYLFCSNLLLKNYFIKEMKHSNRVCIGLCKPRWVWEKSRAGTNTRPSVSCLYYLLSISPKRTSVCISLCKHGYRVSLLQRLLAVTIVQSKTKSFVENT